MKPCRSNPEAEIQRGIVRDVRRLMLPPFFLHHSGNEVRGGGEAARERQSILLDMGIHPGFFDLLLGQSCGEWLGPRLLFLEVKSKTGQLSEAAKEFRDLVTAMGWPYEVVRPSLQTIDAITRHGLRSRVKRPWRGP